MGLFPSLARTPVIRAWVGLEAMCTDHLPLIGPAPGLEGLFLATGMSGHGFALGPGIGSLIADFAQEGEFPKMLLPFDPARLVDPGEGMK